MALDYYAGSFTITATGTSPQSVTGVGFQPKVVIFYWTRNTADGFQASASDGVGVSVDRGTDQHLCVTRHTLDNVATTDADYAKRVTVSIALQVSSGGFNYLATVTTFGADGFTVTPSVNDNTSLSIIKFICLGGSDITDAYAAEFATTTGTGSLGCTGVGFQGNLAFFLGGTLASTGNQSGSHSGMSVGVANGTTQAAMASRTLSGTTATGASQAQCFITASRCMLITRGTTSSNITIDGSFTSFDTDGFTLNITKNLTGTAAGFIAVILKGTFQSSIGVQPRLSGTGDQEVTTGFLPVGVFVGGTLATAVDTDTTESHFCMGAADGTRQHSVWTGDAATINTDANRYSSATTLYTQATNPSTVASQATLSSFAATQFTMNFGTNDTAVRQIFHLALGSAVVASRPMFRGS